MAVAGMWQGQEDFAIFKKFQYRSGNDFRILWRKRRSKALVMYYPRGRTGEEGGLYANCLLA